MFVYEQPHNQANQADAKKRRGLFASLGLIMNMAKYLRALIFLIPVAVYAAEPAVYTGVWEGHGKATLPDNSV